MESPCVFGQYANLLGVVNTPDNRATDNRTAVIFVTSGLLHHVGPFRLYVELARKLERRNILSLRFDLSGIGESVAIGSTGSSLGRASNEIQQAMDYLQSEYGIEKFYLLGLCSGADDSVSAALVDERIAGTVLLDGCAFHTRQYKVRHYLSKLLSMDFWMRRLNRVLRLIRVKKHSHTSSQTAELGFGQDIREFPARDQAAREIQRLVDRGVHMRFVYTGGLKAYYNYKNQFLDMFSDVNMRGNASHVYFPYTDHVASLCEHREEMEADIIHWLETTIKSPG